CEKSEIPMGVSDDMYVTVPTGQYKKLLATLTLNNPLKAPIEKGQVYGSLNITLNDQVIATKPLIALESTQRGGFWRRATDAVRFNINKYFTKTEEKANTG